MYSSISLNVPVPRHLFPLRIVTWHHAVAHWMLFLITLHLMSDLTIAGWTAFPFQTCMHPFNVVSKPLCPTLGLSDVTPTFLSAASPVFGS